MYRVEVFVQGRGWRPLAEVYQYGGPASSYQEAVKLALTAILNRIRKSGENYGSKLGDLVGFRISKAEEGEPVKLPPEVISVEWEIHKHLFYRRGDTFMLYKSWSWPD